MSRIMALDVGEATLGVAVSDPLRMTAQPVGTIRRHGRKRDIRAVADLIAKHDVSSMVVGLPLQLDGEAGLAVESTMSFVESQRKSTGIPVVTWDERLTTVQAERVLIDADLSRKRRREVINHVAAAIILQSYLDSQSPAP